LNAADMVWAQCDKCAKWRLLPPDTDSDKLPSRWYCYMNPEIEYSSCAAREQSEAEVLASDQSESYARQRTAWFEKQQQRSAEKNNSQHSSGNNSVVTSPAQKNKFVDEDDVSDEAAADLACDEDI
jgi:hypothetical protein